MPSKKRKTIAVQTMLIQCLIVLTGILAMLTVAGFNAVRQQRANHLQSLTEAAHQYVNFLKEFEYLPQNILESSYTVFVINQASGDYVINRSRSDVYADLLWEQYRTKLVYQMQKQRQGLIVYPFKKIWQIFTSNKMIRYLTLPEKEWILAIETDRPSEWDLFRRVAGPETLGFGILLMIAMVMLCYLHVRHAMRSYRNAIVDSLEKSFLNVDKDMLYKGPASFKSSAVMPEAPQPVASASDQQQPQDDLYKALSTHLTPDGLKPSSGKKTDAHQKEPLLKTEPLMPHSQPEEPVPETKVKLESEPETQFKPEFSGTQVPFQTEESSEILGEDLEGIRSPVLKKLIKQLREE